MTNPTLLLCVFVLTRQSFSLSGPQCRSCELTSCDCSRQNLREVPAAPSKLIAELDLSFNVLRTITQNDFVEYASLRSLIMKNNVIETIHKQSFAPLTNLEKLDLSFNRLDALSAEWFQNLLSLKHLNLLGNQYKLLGGGELFLPLKKLKTLHVGGVHLRSVRMSDFSGLGSLEELVFDGRNLRDYAEGSLRQIRAIKNVALGLNGPFQRNQALVEALLSDVVHPKTTLTFTDTSFISEDQMSPFRVVNNGGATRVILKNTNVTIGTCMELLHLLSHSNVTMLAIEDTKFFLSFSARMFQPNMEQSLERLEELVLKNIDAPQFYGFPAPFFLKSLINVVRKVSLLNCKVFTVPCKSMAHLRQVEYVDISDNLLSDESLNTMMCDDGKVSLRTLQTLNISRNYLRSINSQLFTELDHLENIDMSGNVFRSMPETCRWPPRLHYLNLSSTYLAHVTTCLPESLRVLDVSHNALTVFNVKLPFLTELHISGNKLKRLPEGGLYPRLIFLSIQNNDLQTFGGNDLSDYNSLMSVEAGANTYVCSCEFVTFMTRESKYHRVAVGDQLKSYICRSSDATRGKGVTDVTLSVFECHTALAVSVLCSGVLAVLLLVAGLCYKFSMVWYVKMTWVWVRAKRKPKLKKGELEYDAFVSYSEMDSGWVEAHLVPELEQVEPRLHLCLHKRDFIPGGWILDSIMDAIEKSHRTVFVLSQHFVRSEWCKYELDYTHFRLFDQNDDAVVLILLEPIDTDTIPKKFCKLRKIMNSTTYLEWPDDDNRVPRFWQSLRAAVKRPETDDGHDVDETVDL